MNISFMDFWGDFNTQTNFFTESLKRCKENIIVTKADDADVIICSLFGDTHKQFYKKKKIVFFTGENMRPTYQSYDISLSFDFDDYDGRNLRLPLWYLYIDWFGIETNGNPKFLIPQDFLYNQNIFSLNKKNKFCTTIFSAYHVDRIDMINKLNTYKNVDYFGKLGNPIPDGENFKLQILSNYKFSICFENSIYPGYFTEKLLHAKIAGTIPIYKSHPTINVDFNEGCFINTFNKSLQEVYDEIINIDNNEKIYKDILDQPLFEKKVEIDDLINKLNNFI